MPATAQARESKITFCNEQWTAESARLLLELDEGWVGFHNAEQWQWSDATYDLFVLECRERRWPCNSRDSCVAMLHALRSGAISMKISNALRSPQGFVQWHPHEMRALGLQMSRLTIGKTRVTSWYKQLVLFIDRMHGKDPDYRFGVEGRTIEHFKQRARRYLADSIVKEIEGCDDIESDSSAQSSAVEQQVEKSSRSMREKSSAVVKKSAVKTNAASSVAGEAKKSKEKTVSSAQIAVNAPVQFSLRRSVSLSVDSVEKTSERKSVSFQEIGVETNKTSTGFREVSMSNGVSIPKNTSADSRDKGTASSTNSRDQSAGNSASVLRGILADRYAKKAADASAKSRVVSKDVLLPKDTSSESYNNGKTNPHEANASKTASISKTTSAERNNSVKSIVPTTKPRSESTSRNMTPTTTSRTENPTTNMLATMTQANQDRKDIPTSQADTSRKNVSAVQPPTDQVETKDTKSATPLQSTHAKTSSKNETAVSTTSSFEETESEDVLLPYQEIVNKTTTVAEAQDESKSNDNTLHENDHTKDTSEAHSAGDEGNSDGEQEWMGGGNINDNAAGVMLPEVEENDKGGGKDNSSAFIRMETAEEQPSRPLTRNMKRAANWDGNHAAAPREQHTDVTSPQKRRRKHQRRVHSSEIEEENPQVESTVVRDNSSVSRPTTRAQASRLSRSSHPSVPSASTRVQTSHHNQMPKQYNPSAMPWGEFVVELLLAEKTARDEDELDYVRFVRDLYDI